MNTETLSTLIEQSKRLLAPLLQLNHVAAANAEKLAALQIASLEYYTELGLGQWKAAAALTDQPASPEVAASS